MLCNFPDALQKFLLKPHAAREEISDPSAPICEACAETQATDSATSRSPAASTKISETQATASGPATSSSPTASIDNLKQTSSDRLKT